jgi:N-acetylneuraminic acid mutarotase
MYKILGLAVALLGATVWGEIMLEDAAITWSRGPDVPLPRGGYGLAQYKNGFVLVGGTFWQDKKKHWTEDVSFFDPASSRWGSLRPLPRPLAYGALVELGGALYLLGGCDDKQVYRDLLRFENGRWDRLGEVPEPLVYSAAAVLNRKIYQTAGSLDVNDLTTGTRKTWIYDPDSGHWTRGPDVPGPPRLLHAAATLGDSLYLFGGCTQNPGGPLTDLADAYRLDKDGSQWESIKPLSLPIRAAGIAVANGSIYLFGGYSGKFLDQVYRYDVAKNDYTLVSHMPVALADTRFAFTGGRFYGATGENAGGSRFAGLLIGRMP